MSKQQSLKETLVSSSAENLKSAGKQFVLVDYRSLTELTEVLT